MMRKTFHVCFYLGFPDCMGLSDEVYTFNGVRNTMTALCDDIKCPADA